MSIQISVILPIYQAQDYLDRCLNSLLTQSLKEFELILIDDGSMDNSGMLCDEYARIDKRVRVKHKENEGVSKARQDGLDMAIGSYIIYVDPDDWVEPKYLESLYEKAIENDADMTVCDFWAEYPNKTLYCSQSPSVLNANTVLEEFFPKHNGCTWNKLIKRELFSKYNVRFPEGVCFCEDLYVNCKLLLNDIRIAYVPKALYHYDQIVNTNSLIRKYNDTTYEHDMALYDMFIELFRASNEPTNLRSTFARNLTERAFWSGIYSSYEFKKKYNRFSEELRLFNDTKGRLYYYSAVGHYRTAYYFALLCKRMRMSLNSIIRSNKNS